MRAKSAGVTFGLIDRNRGAKLVQFRAIAEAAEPLEGRVFLNVKHRLERASCHIAEVVWIGQEQRAEVLPGYFGRKLGKRNQFQRRSRGYCNGLSWGDGHSYSSREVDTVLNWCRTPGRATQAVATPGHAIMHRRRRTDFARRTLGSGGGLHGD